MPSDAMIEAVARSLSLMEMTLANAPVLSGQLIQVWAAVLEAQGFTPEETERAAGLVIAREKFFPQPAVFIEATRPPVNEDTQAEGAWQQVRECARRFGSYASLTAADLNGDGAALWAVDRLEWERVGEVEEDERKFLRAEFIRLYRLAREERKELAYLPGRFERENGANGRELTPALCGRPDWKERPALGAVAAEEVPRELAGVGKALPAARPQGEAPR